MGGMVGLWEGCDMRRARAGEHACVCWVCLVGRTNTRTQQCTEEEGERKGTEGEGEGKLDTLKAGDALPMIGAISS